MALIFWLSTDRFSGSNTGSILEEIIRGLGLSFSPATIERIHFAIRKLAHLSGYAILAVLVYRAFRGGSVIRWRLQWAASAFAVAAGYALFDEYHQSWTRYRTASISDSLIDMAGSLIALAWIGISSYSRHRARDGVSERGK
jgi:VanZ family protein